MEGGFTVSQRRRDPLKLWRVSVWGDEYCLYLIEAGRALSGHRLHRLAASSPCRRPPPLLLCHLSCFLATYEVLRTSRQLDSLCSPRQPSSRWIPSPGKGVLTRQQSQISERKEWELSNFTDEPPPSVLPAVLPSVLRLRSYYSPYAVTYRWSGAPWR